MSLKSVLLAGAASLALLTFAVPTAYADENDETRRLNELQLDHPGAGLAAVPGHEDADDDDDDNGAADDDDDDDDDAVGAPPGMYDDGDDDGDDDDDDGDD